MTTYLISSLLWVSFPLSVLYTSVWQGLVLRFWSLSHTPDDSSPCVPLLSITVLLPWFPHLLCWASIFPLKLHMANLTCALLLKLFYTLTFPFLLMATLLSCSSRPTFCSFFCLKSSCQLFICRLSSICSFFSGPTGTPKELVLVTCLQVSWILLPQLQEPITSSC